MNQQFDIFEWFKFDQSWKFCGRLALQIFCFAIKREN